MLNKKLFRFRGDLSTLIWLGAIGIVCLAAHILVCEGTGISPAVSGLIFLLLDILSSLAVIVIVYRFKQSYGATENSISNNSTAIRDLLQQAHMPIMLTDGTGKIIWYNDDLAISFGIGISAIGTNMNTFCKASEAELLETTAKYYGDTSIPTGAVEDQKALMTIGGRRYRATCYKVRANVKSRDDIREFFMTIFSDITDLTNANELIIKSSPAVAYIIVDNLEELAQTVKASYREQANKVEIILKEWAESMHGTIREYDRDKYMLVFSRDMLDKCVQDKFSVLDKIREIRIGEGDSSLPVTISMGIATYTPEVGNEISLDMVSTSKEAAAALDMALQRGGDQVAVKTESGLEYFGGRTKTIQKRTRVRARVIAGKLCGLIANASNVLIMGHRNPDFDSVGACVGIARLCMFCGVNCKIIVDKSNPNFRVCTEKLLDTPAYSDMFIDSASAVDLLNPSTLLVIADANNFSIIEAPEIAANAKTIYVIDHHRQTTELPQNVVNPPYIDPAASSACELVAEILEQCLPAGALNNEEANVMISGIMVDTKNFTRTTSTRTFGAALYLRGEGANTEITRTFFDEDFSDYIAEAKFGADVKIYRNRIAITRSDGTDTGADRIAAAKAADKLLTIRGVDASFALVTVGSVVNISARSNGKINVQLILEKLSGGGHFDVAGAQLQGSSMEKAAKLLKEAIDEYLDNEI